MSWASENLDRVLNNPSVPTSDELAAADAALKRMAERVDEDPVEWAWQLAETFSKFND